MGVKDSEHPPGPLWEYAMTRDPSLVKKANKLVRMGMKHLDSSNADIQAAECFMQAATLGNALAHYNLGLMHALGRGVERDDEKMAGHFTYAARQGHRDAQAVLAWLYFHGDGVECNREEAAKWFQEAAEKGHAESQHQLAIIHMFGLGLPQDYQKAAKWYWDAAEQDHECGSRIEAMKRSGRNPKLYNSIIQNRIEEAGRLKALAEKGDHNAQFELGYMHELGEGVAASRMLAAKWYKKSYTQGNPKAMAHLAEIIWNDCIISSGEKQFPKEYSKWLIREFGEGDLGDRGLKAKALELSKRAAELGDPKGMLNLSEMLDHDSELDNLGKEFEDPKAARGWFIKSAENGDFESLCELAAMAYYQEDGYGIKIRKNQKKALKWLTKASEEGHEQSKLWLGEMYRDGKQVPKDIPKALHYFIKWAMGHGSNKEELFDLLASQNDLKLLQSAEWVLAGEALQGNKYAQYTLGMIYFEGIVTSNDYPKAAHWLKRSASQGDVDSMGKVAYCYDKGGHGLKTSRVKAYAWLKTATGSGHEDCEKRLLELTPKMTESQIKAAEEMISKLEEEYPTMGNSYP